MYPFDNNNNGFKRRPKEFDYDGFFKEPEKVDAREEFERYITNRMNDPEINHLQAQYTAFRDKKRMEKRKHTPLSHDLSLMTNQDVDEILAYNTTYLHSALFYTIVEYFIGKKQWLPYNRKILALRIAEFQQEHIAPAKDEQGPDINGRIGPRTLAALEKNGVQVSMVNLHYYEKTIHKDTLDTIRKDRELLRKTLLTYAIHPTVSNLGTMTTQRAGLVVQEIINADTLKNGQEPVSFPSDNQVLNDNEITEAKNEALEEKESLPAESVDKNALTGGQLLQESDRELYESKMDADFSNVKIHTDTAANEAAESINAQAFAIGDDIAFAKDLYQPGTKETNRLMAHELAHVAHQSHSPQKGAIVQRAIGKEIFDMKELIEELERRLERVKYDNYEKVLDVVTTLIRDRVRYLPDPIVKSIAQRVGFFRGVESGLRETGRAVYSIVSSVVKNEVLKDIGELIDAISKIEITELLKAAATYGKEWVDRLTSDDPWVSGYAQGYIGGRIVLEVALTMLGIGIASKLKAPVAITSKLSKLKSIQKLQTGLTTAAGFLKKYFEILKKAGGSIARRKRLIFKAALEAAEKAGPVDDLTKKVIKKMVDLYHNRPLVMHFQEHHWMQQVLVTGGKKIHIHEIAPILEKLNINLRKVSWNISKIPHMGGHTNKYLKFIQNQLDDIVRIYEKTGRKMTKEQIESALQKAVNKIKEAVSNGEVLLYNVK